MSDQTKRPSINRRSRVLIDVSTQRALAARMVLHCLSFLIVGSVLAAMQYYFANPMAAAPELLSIMWANCSPFLLAFVLLLPALVLDSLKLSNRIVGPICRLQATVRRLAEGGDPGKLRFRKRDYWQRLPDDFNTMVGRLQRSAEKPEEADFACAAD